MLQHALRNSGADVLGCAAQAAEGMGFAYVAAGPLIRSSYKAGEFFLKNMLRGDEQPKAATA